MSWTHQNVIIFDASPFGHTCGSSCCKTCVIPIVKCCEFDPCRCKKKCDRCWEWDCICDIRCRRCNFHPCRCKRCDRCHNWDWNCNCRKCDHCSNWTWECNCKRCDHCSNWTWECKCKRCDRCSNWNWNCNCRKCNRCNNWSWECNCKRCDRKHRILICDKDRFEPFGLTIRTGDTVKWINNSCHRQWIVSDDRVNTATPCNIDEVICPGDSMKIKFCTPGQWVYHGKFNHDGKCRRKAPLGVITILPKDC